MCLTEELHLVCHAAKSGPHLESGGEVSNEELLELRPLPLKKKVIHLPFVA